MGCWGARRQLLCLIVFVISHLTDDDFDKHGLLLPLVSARLLSAVCRRRRLFDGGKRTACRTCIDVRCWLIVFSRRQMYGTLSKDLLNRLSSFAFARLWTMTSNEPRVAIFAYRQLYEREAIYTVSKLERVINCSQSCVCWWSSFH